MDEKTHLLWKMDAMVHLLLQHIIRKVRKIEKCILKGYISLNKSGIKAGKNVMMSRYISSFDKLIIHSI